MLTRVSCLNITFNEDISPFKDNFFGHLLNAASSSSASCKYSSLTAISAATFNLFFFVFFFKNEGDVTCTDRPHSNRQVIALLL